MTSTSGTSLDTPSILSPRQQAALLRFRDILPQMREQWLLKRHFPYFVIDSFLPAEFAEAIHQSYPPPDELGWDRTTYTHQRRKFTLTSGFPPPIKEFFDLTAHSDFRALISQATDVENVLDDPDLVGGGLHQILRGGFLDVHVDFNFHPRTKLHRRMNLLIYMNKEWRESYQGSLELWNMQTRQQIETVAPIFNRAVMFETNEVSYHGHPKPLDCPQNVTRKSLAIYYYTADRESSATATEHNTLYKQTTGASGYAKTAMSSATAIAERMRDEGIASVGATMAGKIARRLRKLPPENK